jgi:FixJ family two-component response regulator
MVWRSRDTRISIVDDDDLVRASFRDCMESAEYVVRDFASAEEFLAAGCEEETDCLILDVRLPGMTGIELQTKLIEADCGFPIVFITAHADNQTRDRAVRKGAAGFLNKPIQRESLLNSIRTALQSRHKGGGPY